jgi:hypothetical protein
VPRQEAQRALHPALVGTEVLAQQLDEAPQQREALLGRRQPDAALVDLAKQPRLDQRPARQHHRAHAAARHPLARLVVREDVAVADHRHRALGGDAADDVPVGGAAVALLAGAAVDRDRRGAVLLARLRDLRDVLLVLFPAEPQLDGDGHLHRLRHGRHQTAEPRGLAQQARAQPTARDLVDRAAAVEVHEVRAARLGEPRALGEAVGLVVGELDAEERLVGMALEQREFGRAAAQQLAHHGHLPERHPRAELHAQPPEGQVPADGERRQDDCVLERRRAHEREGPRLSPRAAVAAGSGSSVSSPSPGARNRLASSPCCRSYISR